MPSEAFVDRPKPSRGYLALVVLCIAVVCPIAFAFPCLQGPVIAALFAVTVFPLVLLTIEMLHAAYGTEYRISGGVVELRCGWLMHRRIQVNEIQAVEHAKFISRVLGWSPGVFGYCNRFSNGLLIKTPRYSAFVSPADVEGFVKALQVEAGIPSPAAVEPVESPGSKWAAALLFGFAGLIIVALAIPLILGVVPPNGFYGVRTAATMSSPEVWYPAIRIGGMCMLVAGLAIIAGGTLLAAYARRLSVLTITLIGAGWTLLCLLTSVAVTMVYIQRLL